MNETNSIKQIRIMLLVPGERWPKPGQTLALIYWELPGTPDYTLCWTVDVCLFVW